MSEHLKLAITRIGDLLIHKKITQDDKGDVINGINLVIPEYQRPYKWSAKNVIQLLDDILDAKTENKEAYRVGTLILHSSGESKYDIVDGQQRIITFALLLSALGEKNISFLEQSLSENPYNRYNIPKNFRTLDRRVKNLKEEKDKEELLEYIKNNCELIIVVTEVLAEAFQFFDSQNARGKKLYPHDLLKAFHLREMNNLSMDETESVVKEWEELDQIKLSLLFGDYLYRLREWVKGNKAWELDEKNIHKFKGITSQDNFPFAQFYKGAYAYADMINKSSMPFVYGNRNLRPFQLDTPIIAGKPFFDYAKHYFGILEDIQNNDKYEGYFINDNDIVKTLDIRKNKNGVGNRIARLLFDTSILLYIDRFTPSERPSKLDTELLDQFVLFAFIWSYSLRAQYKNLGWQSAQNYIMGNPVKHNSFNIYKVINEADSPVLLSSVLSDKINPLPSSSLMANKDNIDEKNEDGIYENYLHYFKKYNFIG